MKTLLVAVSLCTLTACTTAPKPPQATGTPRPVNSLATAEMLAHEAGYMIVGEGREKPVVKEFFLYNNRLHLARPVEQRRLFTRPANRSDYAEVPGAMMIERTVRVPFAYASARFQPTPEQRLQIRQLAAVADRVEVRGRTDGRGNRATNERVAQRRAEAAKRYLLDRGVPGSIISVNYQAAGDYIADNERTAGRGLNRRVELEFFIDDFTIDRPAPFIPPESDTWIAARSAK